MPQNSKWRLKCHFLRGHFTATNTSSWTWKVTPPDKFIWYHSIGRCLFFPYIPKEKNRKWENRLWETGGNQENTMIQSTNSRAITIFSPFNLSQLEYDHVHGQSSVSCLCNNNNLQTAGWDCLSGQAIIWQPIAWRIVFQKCCGQNFTVCLFGAFYCPFSYPEQSWTGYT